VRSGVKKQTKSWLWAGVSGSFLALAPLVSAQEGGLWATFDLSSQLSIDDNLQMETPSLGVTTSLDNAFSFMLTSRTRTQSLTFSASGIGRGAVYPGGTTLFAIQDPGAGLSYSREAASSSISANASYLLQDLSYVDWTETVSYSFDDFLQYGTGSYTDWIASLGSGEETSYLVSGGTRETLSFGATYEFGKDSPLGGSIRVAHSQVAYADANPALVDESTDLITGTAGFEITPTLKGGAALRVAQTTSGGSTSQSQSLRFGLDQDFDGGLIGVSFSSDLSGTASANVNRSLDWSTGSLTFDLGLSMAPGGTGASAGLGYRQEFKNAVFGASLSLDTDPGGSSGAVRASYRHEINDIGRLSFSFNYSGSAPGGGDADQRAKLSASYSRDITEDIYMTAGYSFDYLDTTGADAATSNGVFVGIGRTYSFRPW
jgi:hypothetical protein